MTGFWLLALAMGVVAAAFVVWPLFRARGEDRGRQVRSRSNLAIFEDRLAELRADLEAGHIGEEEFGSLRAELERSLLQDVDEADLEVTGAPRVPSRSGSAPDPGQCAGGAAGGDGPLRGLGAVLGRPVRTPVVAGHAAAGRAA
ncbi:MAG: c-type cytochrome biogenesis protein CcmI [Gammaproteobacteria bacterium]|nr:c-type cytochrome biogenesis protein CcmI [Gammaproteobacteria bacterium]